MLDDMTFQGVQSRLENSLIALRGYEISPEQFTKLSIIMDNLTAQILSAVRKEPTEAEINGVILLAEQEFNASAVEQKQLIREMAQGEEIIPLTDMFGLNDNDVKGKIHINEPQSINDKIKAKLNEKK